MDRDMRRGTKISAGKEVSAMRKVEPSADDYVLIFRPYITLKNGRRLYASSRGLKAWPLWVRRNKRR